MGQVHGDCPNGNYPYSVAMVISLFPFTYKSVPLLFVDFVPLLIPVCLCFSFGDHYELDRVTSCIHNILNGQRWIEHYGEMTIRNIANEEDTSVCKVTFFKVNPNFCSGLFSDSVAAMCRKQYKQHI